MSADRARVSHDPSRKWTGVIAQQGRVTIEADWNEAATIDAERDRQLTLDVVGTVGTPDAGYAVTAVTAAGSPPASAGSPPASAPGNLVIGPGTLYLGGERLDLDAPVAYSAQPDWLDHSTDPLWVPPAVPAGASYELVYLLASEHEVSAVEDPALADVALGGPDTMARRRILQRFVRQPGQSSTCHGSWSALVNSLGSAGLRFDPASMMIRSTTSLQVSFTSPGRAGPCQPAAAGGYLGAENQMIRVMVTSVDASGVPTIVWGFDDASFLYRVQAAPGDAGSGDTTLTLASAPADSYRYPAAGQAVELLRDAVQLTATDYIASAAGFVSTLTAGYAPASMSLTISGEPPGDYLSATPQLYLRVWQATAAAPPGQPVPLVAVNQVGAAADTGVAVTLSSSTGAFHQGDFWRFALRPIEPATVYPARYLAAPQPPDVPRTWACPLAVLEWEAGSATALHCVPPFADLVELTAKGGCCTVDLGPADVDGGASLPALLQSYANRGPLTVCLEPGTYTIPAPLVLGPGLDGLTLQGCLAGVVLRAPSGPAAGFISGLIEVQGASSVTIRGIELAPPPVAFSPAAGAFAGLTGPNQVLLTSFSAELQVAFGISASSTADLAIEDCTFSLPNPVGTSFFGAGIYATGTMTGVTVTNCTFRSAGPLTTAPFYDLAASSQPPQPPWQLTFGCLQVPISQSPSAGGAGEQLLDDATIRGCLFQDVTVAALLMAELGSQSVDRNTVRDSYGGFWLVSLDPAHYDFFDKQTVGPYLTAAEQGNAPLVDPILVMAPAIGRALPLPPSMPPEPGTGVSLRLDFRDCQVNAVLAGSNSGAGLLVVDLAEAAGSAVVHGSRIRNHFPAGDTALAYLLQEASVTGNILANEAAAAELPAQNTSNFSIVLSATATPLGVPGRGRHRQCPGRYHHASTASDHAPTGGPGLGGAEHGDLLGRTAGRDGDLAHQRKTRWRGQRDDHRPRLRRGHQRAVRDRERPCHAGRLRYPDHRHQPRRQRHRGRHRDQSRRALSHQRRGPVHLHGRSRGRHRDYPHLRDRRRRDQRHDHRQRLPRRHQRAVRDRERPRHTGRLRYPDYRHQPGRQPRHRGHHRDQSRRALGHQRRGQVHLHFPADSHGGFPRQRDRGRRDHRDDHRERFLRPRPRPRQRQREVRDSERPCRDGRLRYPGHRHQPGRERDCGREGHHASRHLPGRARRPIHLRCPAHGDWHQPAVRTAAVVCNGQWQRLHRGDRGQLRQQSRQQPAGRSERDRAHRRPAGRDRDGRRNGHHASRHLAASGGRPVLLPGGNQRLST